MALERDLELLDDYLANRMSDAERSVMEQKIASDPELSRELSIQRQVVEGLRQARIAELKQMLNNTPIPPPAVGGQALLLKLGTAAVTAGIIGTGLYFFFKDPATGKPQQQATPVQQESIAAAPQGQQPVQEPAIDPQVATPQASEPKPVAPAPNKKKATVDTSAQPAGEPQKPTAFAPTEEASESAVPSGDAPVMNGTAINARKSSMAVENAVDKKYNFHYQFKEGKLLLYGPFSEKSTYEVLEFFADNKHNTVVLFYNNNFYLLEDANDKVTPLKPITDPALLNKLKEYRKK
jgi:hypothetical protein